MANLSRTAGDVALAIYNKMQSRFPTTACVLSVASDENYYVKLGSGVTATINAIIKVKAYASPVTDFLGNSNRVQGPVVVQCALERNCTTANHAENLTPAQLIAVLGDVMHLGDGFELYMSDYGTAPVIGTITGTPDAVWGHSVSSALSQPTVNFVTASETVLDNTTSKTVTVTLSGQFNKSVTVPYTIGGTAANPGDYTITASPLVFTSGQTSKNITITLVNQVAWQSNKTVILTLGTPTNADVGLGYTVHTTTIENHLQPEINFAGAAENIIENAGATNIVLNLSHAYSHDITVPWVNTGTAVVTTDYTFTASPITFTAGQTTKNLVLTPVNHLATEGDRTVICTLGAPTTGNATLGATKVNTATIKDYLPQVQFSVVSETKIENAGAITIAVELNHIYSENVVVPFTIGGTATNPADYTISASPLTITAGALTANITVTLVNRAGVQGARTVILTLGAPTSSNATLGTNTVNTLTIQDL